MPKCGYCGTTIIMGGAKAGGQVYCNQKCLRNAQVFSAVAQSVPPDVLEKAVEQVWAGNCPQCGGPGPNDIHRIYQVWSALAFTRWSTKSQISCRSCGVKRQLAGTIFSFLFGWWGIPSGIVLTPVQITRNIRAMISGPDPSCASDDLRRQIRVNLGTKILASQKAAPPARS